METDMISQFKETQIIPASLGSRVVPSWLPAPPVPQTRPAVKRQARTVKTKSIWIAPEGDSLTEKLMLTLLVFAAATGVGYAFLGLLNLVQNWGAFNGWVSQIVQ